MGVARHERLAVAPMPEHEYLSTACLHGEHDYCAATQAEDAEGWLFSRRPAQCKFCQAPCVCPCHAGASDGSDT